MPDSKSCLIIVLLIEIAFLGYLLWDITTLHKEEQERTEKAKLEDITYCRNLPAQIQQLNKTLARLSKQCEVELKNYEQCLANCTATCIKQENETISSLVKDYKSRERVYNALLEKCLSEENSKSDCIRRIQPILSENQSEAFETLRRILENNAPSIEEYCQNKCKDRICKDPREYYYEYLEQICKNSCCTNPRCYKYLIEGCYRIPVSFFIPPDICGMIKLLGEMPTACSEMLVVENAIYVRTAELEECQRKGYIK